MTEARADEPVIEPDLPIVDSHHHLYDRPGERYLLPELLADLRTGHDIRATVYVEGGSMHRHFSEGGTMYRAAGPEEWRSLGEVEFANGVAAMSASGQYGTVAIAAGIVGFADLSAGAEVRRVLEVQVARAADRYRGVRYYAGWDASPEVRSLQLMTRPGMLGERRFREGFAALRDLGLSFDAHVNHPQLGELFDLVRLHPDIPVILNHMGGPIQAGPYAAHREEAFAQWRDGLRALAALPNVFVKLGALGRKAAGHGFQSRATPPTSEEVAAAGRRHVETCIETFGPARCLFESNFPGDRRSFGYRVLWNAFKRITAAYSRSEREAMFAGTACRVYRLPALRGDGAAA
jgi:predicted TIM-barrel fold metal-dependent hydrolase